MRRVFAVSSVVLIVIVISVGVVFLPFVTAKISGRGVIYSSGDAQSKYSGYGVVREHVDKQLFVNPTEGVPFFAPLEQRQNFEKSRYTIIEISEQERISYIVGHVVGWQKIRGSSDEYLLLYSDKSLKKYRVAYDNSPIFGLNPTLIMVETVDHAIAYEDEQNKVEKPKNASPTAIGKAAMHKLISRGDVVVLRTVWDLPEMAKSDELGNYLTSRVIMRRVDADVQSGQHPQGK